MKPVFSTQLSQNQLAETAQRFLVHFSEYRVFAFFGEIGVGKTTFIKTLCQTLNVENITSSPTFAIVNEYFTTEGELVYHFDFYRINDIREALDIGFFDYIESNSYCFLEWSENIEELLENEVYVRVELERIDDATRNMVATVYNE